MSSQSSRHRSEYRVEIGGSVARDQCDRFRLGRCFTEKEDDLGLRVWRELEPGLESAAGVEAGADAIGERRCRSQARPDDRACRCGRETPFGRRSRQTWRPARSAKATRLPYSALPMVPRQHRAGLRIDLGHDERRGGGAGSAQHPFHVRGDREPARDRRE